MDNYQHGGWYTNPATGKVQQYWNGQWYDTPQQGTQNDPMTAYNTALAALDKSTNNYYDQQQGFYQKGHDITSDNLNQQNALAIGSQGQGASDAFANGIENPLQKTQGSYQYKYGLDTGNENALYNLNSGANAQNRDLALGKLNADEQYAMQSLNQQQGIDNQKTLEDLNSRGLLYGQNPGVGSYYQGDVNGLGGLAGQTMREGPNQQYDISKGQQLADYGLGVQGANADFAQKQGLLDQNHTYGLANDAYDTVNNLQNQKLNFGYQTGVNDNQLEMYKAQLNNAKQTQLQNNKQNALNQGALSTGTALYK